MFVGVATLPTVSWLHASMLGFIPTVFDLRELGDNAFFWCVLTAMTALTGQAWRRMGAWKFLGVRRPSLVPPTLVAAAAAAIGLLLRLPLSSAFALSALGGVMPLALTISVLAWWSPRKAAALLPGDSPAPPPKREGESSQPAAATVAAARVRAG